MSITLPIVKNRIHRYIIREPGVTEAQIYSIGDMFNQALMDMIYDSLEELEQAELIYSVVSPNVNYDVNSFISSDKFFFPVNLTTLWKRYTFSSTSD